MTLFSIVNVHKLGIYHNFIIFIKKNSLGYSQKHLS